MKCQNFFLNVKLKIFDPFFVSENVFGYNTQKSLSEAITDSDAIILITGHKEFENLNLDYISNSITKPILIDCTGKIDPIKAKSQGIIFKAIGRGVI